MQSIWKLKAPPRVVIFDWLVLRKRIPSMDNLRRRGMTIANGCPMCLRDEESVDHLLLNCKEAQSLWRAVVGWFDCRWVFPKSLIELFQAWKEPIGIPRGKELWRFTFLAVIWIIWKERNSRCFEGKESSVSSLVERIKVLVAL